MAFGNELEKYADSPQPVASYREPTLAEKLDLAVVRAEKRLADAREAREILNRNPDIEQLIDILGRNGNF